MKFRLCTNGETLETLASRPEFLNSYIFTGDLVGVHLAKDKVILNKPIFIGQAVLDLSKLVMYELYYDQLQGYATKLGGSISIAGGDTDSFFLRTSGIDVANKLIPLMRRDGLLDTSNYPPTHPDFSNAHKAQLGCIKDEAAGKPFREWVLLRPKAYSMLAVDGKECKRAKGVRRATLNSEISHSDYRRAYKEQVTLSHTQRRIGSINHQLYNLTYNKKTLSFFEDKRAWVSINRSLPYGNHQLGSMEKPSRKRVTNYPKLVEPAAKRAHID